MKNLDIFYLCTVIGNLSGIPVRIFEGKEQVFYYSVVQLPKDPMSVYCSQILEIQENISYFSAERLNHPINAKENGHTRHSTRYGRFAVVLL